MDDCLDGCAGNPAHSAPAFAIVNDKSAVGHRQSSMDSAFLHRGNMAEMRR
jgi:hypothetical protein